MRVGASASGVGSFLLGLVGVGTGAASTPPITAIDISESVPIGSGVLGGMGKLVTESVTTSREFEKPVGAPTPIPDLNRTGETPEASDARSDARDGDETEASNSQNSDERRERPSRDPFGRATGQLSESDSNRMLTVTGVMVVVGLMAVIGIIVFRRRRSD